MQQGKTAVQQRFGAFTDREGRIYILTSDMAEKTSGIWPLAGAWTVETLVRAIHATARHVRTGQRLAPGQTAYVLPGFEGGQKLEPDSNASEAAAKFHKVLNDKVREIEEEGVEALQI